MLRLRLLFMLVVDTYESLQADMLLDKLCGPSCRAISHDRLGNHAAAVADFSAALELNPSNTSAFFNRGTCFDSLGQHDLATADFGRALELDIPSGPAESNAGPTARRASQDVTMAGGQVASAERLTGGADDAISRETAHSAVS